MDNKLPRNMLTSMLLQASQSPFRRIRWIRRMFLEAEAEYPRSMEEGHIELYSEVEGSRLVDALRALQNVGSICLTEVQCGLDHDQEVITLNWDDGFLAWSRHTRRTGGGYFNVKGPKGRGDALVLTSLACFIPYSEETQQILDALRPFIELTEKRFRIRAPKRSIGLITAGHAGLDIDEMPLPNLHRFEPANYIEGTQQAFADLKAFVQGRTPPDQGGLVLIDGPPGTGKTNLLRGLIRDVAAPFVLVSGSTIASLEDPGFIPFVIAQARVRNGLVLLLEDADSVIVNREFTQDVGLLSLLLNSTSGLLGDLTQLRVIATVNTWQDDRVDEAVLRPGRLFRRLTLGALAPDHARAVVLRLTQGSELAAARIKAEPTTLAECYAIAREFMPVKQAKTKGAGTPAFGRPRLVGAATTAVELDPDYEEA